MKRANLLFFVFAVLLMMLTLSGCNKSVGDNENKDIVKSEEKGILSGSVLDIGKYGRTKELNGIQMYIDDNGVVTTEISKEGYTFVYVEYEMKNSGGSPVQCCRWVGFEKTSQDFGEGAVLRVQPIAEQDYGMYEKYYQSIDENYKAMYSENSIELFRVWIEKADGSEVLSYDEQIGLLFQWGDTGITQAFGVEDSSDENLEHNFVMLGMSKVPAGKYAKISVNHSSKAIAIIKD